MKKEPTKRYHLILDAIGVKQNYLRNEDFLETILKEVSKLIGMKIIHGPVIIEGYKKNPGLSAFCIIDYSHISIHTFIKDKEFCFDVFSCRPFDYSKVKNYLIKKLNIDSKKVFKSEPKYEKPRDCKNPL